MMALDKDVGLGRFSNKFLMSSRSLHWNALISALSSESTSFARSQNFVAYVEAARDYC